MGRPLSIILLLVLLLMPVDSSGQVPSLLPLAGPPVSLKDLEGKVVILTFAGSWVPFLSRELSMLQRVANRYEAQQVVLFWVTIDSAEPGTKNYSSSEQIQAFLKRSNLRIGVLRDPEMAAYKHFGLEAVPTVILIDQKGRVVQKYVGIDTGQGELYTEIGAEIERLLR
ncbi:MAG: TlpA family protein disulfide reductase [Acidobacteria bacterium]|nr:TlpA family protein disulfide reductase [Acidobacteriota bacterium]